MSVRLRSLPVPFDVNVILAQNERFELVGELGRGASAVVYEVKDRARNEHVALKVHFRKDARTREALAAELQIAAEISHPNVVRVHETGLLEDKPYLLMERVSGMSLSRFVRDGNGRLDEQRLRACLVQLVSALNALHAAHRVHRDVKPSNIRVTGDGRVVLLDLGIAAERGDLVWAEPGIGTPSYMAPEQVTGGIVGPPADLYAVGVVLYELLTGSLPHPEAATGQTQLKLKVDAPRPSSLRPDLPEDLDALCVDLLARDPELRPEAGLVLKSLGCVVADLALRVTLHAPIALAGRDEQLGIMNEALLRAHANGLYIALHGPQGRGKRSFMGHFAALLEQRSAPPYVWRGRCHAASRSAYDGIDALLQDLAEDAGKLGELANLPSSGYAAWLSQVFPVLRFARGLSQAKPESAPVPDPSVRRQRALTLLREVVSALTATRPALVWLEHGERADPEAMNVLSRAFLGVPNVLVVVSTSELGPVTRPGAKPEVLELPPLEESALLEMVDEQWVHSLGDLAPDALGLARASQGEPWGVLELCRTQLRGQRLHDAQAALRARLGGLAEPARHMLNVLAVVGRPLAQHTWLEITGLEERSFHRQLFMLLESAWIERMSDWLSPAFELAHEPLREVLLGQLSREARVELHRCVSLSSARHGDISEEERAAHVVAAGFALDAARSFEQLAEEAEARLAFRHASMLRERALELDPPRERPGAERLRRAGNALSNAGRPARAAEAFGAALALASPGESLALRRLRAEALMRACRIREGLETSHELLAQVGLSVHDSERRTALDLLWQRTLLAVRGTRFKPKPTMAFAPYELSRIDSLLGMSLMLGTVEALRGAELQARGLRLALREREPVRVARALSLHLLQQAMEDPSATPRSLLGLQQARELAKGRVDPALAALFDLMEGALLLLDVRPREALTLTRRAEQRLLDECAGSCSELWMARTLSLAATAQSSSMAELSLLVTNHLEAAQNEGDALLESVIRLQGATQVALLARDAPEEASAAVADAMAPWPDDRPYVQHVIASLMSCAIAQYRQEPGPAEQDEALLGSLAEGTFRRSRSLELALSEARAGLYSLNAARAPERERAAPLAELRKALRSLEASSSDLGRYFYATRLPAERHLAGELEDTRVALSRLHALCNERSLLLPRLRAELCLSLLDDVEDAHQRRERAERELRAVGVANPLRYARTLLPALSPLPSGEG